MSAQPQLVVNWTYPKLQRFKRAYEAAAIKEVEQFHFEGGDYLTSYAKHLISYLETKLKPA